MARALAWHARGRRFDSGILHKVTTTKPLFSKGFVFFRNLSDTYVWPYNSQFGYQMGIKNPKGSHSKAKAVFADFEHLFPTEASVMNLMKKRKYNDFPIILQKLEAQMLLHRVAKRVYDVNPDIPLFTIHDSILTTKQHASTLKCILEDEYQKLLGFIPQFEKTEYSEHNAWGEIAKYTKSKVDQADLEISEDGFMLPESFRFLKCEHWNFNKKQKEKIIIPDFADYNTTPAGLEKVTSKNPFLRKLKK